MSRSRIRFVRTPARYGVAIAVGILMFAASACTEEQYVWWEQQADEVSDEDVRDFCASRLEYCSEVVERLRVVIDDLTRSVTIEWGERFSGPWRSLFLPEPYRTLCSAMDGSGCWSLHYDLKGDWTRPPYRVSCLTDGEPSQMFEWDGNRSRLFGWNGDISRMLERNREEWEEWQWNFEHADEAVGCIFSQMMGWIVTPTGTAQVVIDGVSSNILPSK